MAGHGGSDLLSFIVAQVAEIDDVAGCADGGIIKADALHVERRRADLQRVDQALRVVGPARHAQAQAGGRRRPVREADNA